MKKLLIITTVASLTALSSFAQGYCQFSGSTRGTWDLFTAANLGTPKLGATMNVGFMWGSGPAAITSIQAATLTNSLAANAQATASIPADWTAILGDSNFHLAVDSTTGNPMTVANVANGSWSYSDAGGTIVPIAGTSANSTVSIYIIGWDKQYATAAAAQAAGSAVGWSSVFSYGLVSNTGTPVSMPLSGSVPFGVVPPVPEPASFALAGLGMAAMLVSRRRK